MVLHGQVTVGSSQAGVADTDVLTRETTEAFLDAITTQPDSLIS